jgi:Transposase DDE domain group 1
VSAGGTLLIANVTAENYASFHYQAGSWAKPRRVIAKVEWHPGELVPRVGFIVTNMARPAENVVAFYNKRGTCERSRPFQQCRSREFKR